MNKRSIIINSVATNGDKLQKTLTDVNPAATASTIVNFTRALNGLTTNSYGSTQSVDLDVVMSTTPDPKAPACYFTAPELITTVDYVMVELENYGGKPPYAYFKEDSSFNLPVFDTDVIGGVMYFCTDSDAKPVVGKMPTYVNIVLTDLTNYVRNAVASNLDLKNDDDQLIFPTTERQIADQLNQIYYDEENVDEIVAAMTPVYTEALLTGKKYWKISIQYGADGAKVIGDYIISLPATVKHSAASFKFSVVPDLVEP